MTRRGLLLSLVVTVLVVVVAVVWWRLANVRNDAVARPTGPTPRTVRKPVAPRVDLGLVIWPGETGGTSLLVLRMWSGVVRQADLDNAARKVGEQRPIEPVVLSVPTVSWSQAAFRVLPSGTTAQASDGAALSGVALVGPPASERLSLGPRDTVSVQYRVPTSSLPTPGSLLVAQLHTEFGTIVSEPVSVPPAPDSEKGLLLRKAEILLKLGSHADAGLVGDALIRQFPQEAAGYWIKGQAREAASAADEALALYRTALAKALSRADAAAHEPPVPIISKIQQLEARRQADRQ